MLRPQQGRPGILSDDAVLGQSLRLLDLLHGRFGIRSKLAVHEPAGIAVAIEKHLQGLDGIALASVSEHR